MKLLDLAPLDKLRGAGSWRKLDADGTWPCRSLKPIEPSFSIANSIDRCETPDLLLAFVNEACNDRQEHHMKLRPVLELPAAATLVFLEHVQDRMTSIGG